MSPPLLLLMGHVKKSHVNRRSILKSVGAGFTVSALAGCVGGNGNGDGDDNTIHYGGITPLSGPYGWMGGEERKGLDLAVAEINESDEILPDHEIEVSWVDSETDPDTGLAAAREYVDRENVDILGGAVSSGVAAALSNYAANENIIYLLHSATDRALSTGENCQRVTFQNHMHTEQQSGPCGKWAGENLGDTAYILYQDYSYGHASRDAAIDYFEETGGEVLETTGLPLGHEDFASVLDDIISVDPDWLFMGMSAEGAAFFPQAVERGLEVPMISQWLPADEAGVLTEEVIDELPPVYTNSVYSEHVDTPKKQEYAESFREMYDEGPTSTSTMIYRVGTFMGEVLEQTGGSADADEFIEAAENDGEGTTYEAPMGEVHVRACDHQAVGQSFIEQLSGIDTEAERGTFELVEEVDLANFIPDCADVECEF